MDRGRELLGGPERIRLTGERRPDRRLLEHPIGLPTPGAPADHTPWRIRSRRVVSDRRKGRRVRHRKVRRDVEQHDRLARRRSIEIVAGRMTPLGEQRIVVAVPDHDLAGRGPSPFDPRAQGRDDVLDRLHGPDRRRRRVQVVDEEHHESEVAVGVDEAGKERALPELDDARRGTDRALDLGARADGGDRVAADRDPLRIRGRGIDGQDVLAEEDEVGDLDRSGRGNGRTRTRRQNRDRNNERRTRSAKHPTPGRSCAGRRRRHANSGHVGDLDLSGQSNAPSVRIDAKLDRPEAAAQHAHQRGIA